MRNVVFQIKNELTIHQHLSDRHLRNELQNVYFFLIS